jgi:hypothetical protein
MGLRERRRRARSEALERRARARETFDVLLAHFDGRDLHAALSAAISKASSRAVLRGAFRDPRYEELKSVWRNQRSPRERLLTDPENDLLAFPIQAERWITAGGVPTIGDDGKIWTDTSPGWVQTLNQLPG